MIEFVGFLKRMNFLENVGQENATNDQLVKNPRNTRFPVAEWKIFMIELKMEKRKEETKHGNSKSFFDSY